MFFSGLLLLGLVAGCGSAPDGTAPDSAGAASSDAVSAASAASTPSPMVLQFVGVYEGTAPSGETVRVELRRDGHYAFTSGGALSPEMGSFHGPARAAELPLVLKLVTRGQTTSATITGYDGELHVTRNGVSMVLEPLGVVGPNEDVCDDSSGTWTDDDADADGLYCICPAGTVYIPSQGGCVP